MKNPTCSAAECESEVSAKRLCRRHYHREYQRSAREKTRKPRPDLVRTLPCSVADCDRMQAAKGMCKLHYGRLAKNGSTDKRVVTFELPHKRTPIEDRLWSKVDKSGDCWLWTGAVNKPGYGAIWDNGLRKKVMVHRLSWELVNGPILEGLQIDHWCRMTRCVKPDHLEPVTPQVNTLRGYGPQIAAGIQKAKTHCPSGHPYDAVNTYVDKRGGRHCKACSAERARKRRSRMRQEK